LTDAASGRIARSDGAGGAAAIGAVELTRLVACDWDLIIIGGGITGAGVARHAAQAGLTTLLVEADDFAAGTSSRSTKLIHGGLRYLAMGDFGLVREGALERKSLVAMAPHLAEPRWMLVPARTRLEFWKLRIGIGLYERLGAVVRADRHRNLTGQALSAVEPGLDQLRTPWACRYREYHTDDARLVLTTLRAAARDGAVVGNYLPVTGIDRREDHCLVQVHDLRSGTRASLRARAVVNAAGPWVESVLNTANRGMRGDGSAGRALQLSKGVHIVVPYHRLPVANMVMMTAADGRPVFAIARDGVTFVGTTDTPHVGEATIWPPVLAAEVAYLLETANAHFPAARLAAHDVTASWAGLRPLILQRGKSPREMSRRDEIWRDGPLVTIAGGKLTGFRRMAEETLVAVSAVLGRSVTMPAPLAPLPGGDIADVDALRVATATRYQVDERVAARLVRLYGSEVATVLGERPQPLSQSVFVEEIRWAIEVEGARSLADVVYRRLRSAWFQPEECAESLGQAAAFMGRELGWDEAHVRAEIKAVADRLRSERAAGVMTASSPAVGR
jgi:glycerol-3-phosphate dehydrogenase